MFGLQGIRDMNTGSFKPGDSVIVNGRDNGKIIKTDHPVKDDNNKPGALVEFDDQNLVPPQMGVPYRSIVKQAPTKVLPVGKTQKIFDINQDSWCYGMDNGAECTHDWELHKGFLFDKLICKRCNQKKDYLPMEGE